jgi:hypothetical protein
LTEEELIALFFEIDKDRSNTIDIDEITLFITNKMNEVKGKAAEAVLKVKIIFCKL